MTETIEIKPQAGPQTLFLSSSADIVIYGGAAGGGKTWGLLLEPLRHVHNGQFGAVVFRRTYRQVTQEGGMWDESGNIYPYLGARANQNDLSWHFPSGARVSFGHMQHETSKFNYKGAQIALICFDQLEDFTEGQFFYLISRNRSVSGVKPYVRGTCNPDPDSWLATFISWWIDEETGFPIPERAGVLRWFVNIGGELAWSDTRDELVKKYPKIEPKSLTFIPANVHDNKILMEKDPAYLSNLQALGLVDQARLLGGNWKVRAEAGKVFNRGWFEIVDAVPAGGVECRFWDFASTKKEMAKDDPDFMAGVKIRKIVNEHGAFYYIMDCTAFQEGPSEGDRLFVNISRQDAQQARAEGVQYLVRWEIEPGSAGIREARRLTSLLDGLDAKGVPSREEKLIRAKPLAAQAYAGNVKLIKGAWNERWLTHMHNQPEAPHDDIMDASSGAYNELLKATSRKPARSYQG